MGAAAGAPEPPPAVGSQHDRAASGAVSGAGTIASERRVRRGGKGTTRESLEWSAALWRTSARLVAAVRRRCREWRANARDQRRTT
jgi:hypothetical protein